MDYLKETKMDKIPPRHIQDKIRSIGTPEQIATLDKRLEQEGVAATGDTKKVTAYFKSLEAPEGMNEDSLRGAAQRFFKAKLHRGAKQRPDLCSYKTTRKLLWDRYCDIVFEESKLSLKQQARQGKEVLDGNSKVVMSNFCYWLLGMEKPGGTGPGFDPDKSIIFWGDLGVGKSTIGRAGESVLAYYKYKLQWTENYYTVTNMDSMFLNLIATQDTQPIGEMGKGNLMIDELKEKHFSYKHYGNEIPLIHTVLLARHEEWKWSGRRTIITTNIAKPRWTGENSVFGDARLEDRVAQEYQFVELRGSNKRKPGARL